MHTVDIALRRRGLSAIATVSVQVRQRPSGPATAADLEDLLHQAWIEDVHRPPHALGYREPLRACWFPRCQGTTG